MFEAEIKKKIAVLDFGGQYAHLIANKLRRLGVHAVIAEPEEYKADDTSIAGIIFSGGPKSVDDKDTYSINFDLRKIPVPILGICYGHQLIAHLFGGRVNRNKNNKEYGLAKFSGDTTSLLFRELAESETVWMNHGDFVETLPPGFRSIGKSENFIGVTAFESSDNRIFGVQFHPEVTHTLSGIKILDNFLKLCEIERKWNKNTIKHKVVEETREKIGSKKVFLLISGGVDSLVTLSVLIKAIGPDRVYPLHIDTGLMRLNESKEVIDFLEKLGIKNLRLVQAEELFLKGLDGITEPEEKRKIIGKLFVEILDQETKKYNFSENEWLLAQGTIYPDTIESGKGKSAKIKTHHNRVEEISALLEKGLVVEPISELYKDEVRELGSELGLPENLVNRHPFPGPGLGIRVICSTTGDQNAGFEVDLEEIRNIATGFGYYAKPLPVKSVGIQGDYRSYKFPVLIWPRGDFSWESAGKCSQAIVNKVSSINRVVFSFKDLNDGIFQGKNLMEKETLDLLRKVDKLVMSKIETIREIWQMAVISLPLFDERNRQLFVMRPVCSEDAMTADFYRMDPVLLKNIEKAVSEIQGVSTILYDISTKPPATIEWE